MTKEQIKRMEELEEEYSEFLSDAKTMKERMEKCYDVVLTLINYKNSNHEYWTFCKENFPKINELYELYSKFLYNPKDDEADLVYLFKEDMTIEAKLEILSLAYWTVRNSGYCESMANKLSSGNADSQTQRWQKNCSNIYAIERYYDWLKEKVNK